MTPDEAFDDFENGLLAPARSSELADEASVVNAMVQTIASQTQQVPPANVHSLVETRVARARGRKRAAFVVGVAIVASASAAAAAGALPEMPGWVRDIVPGMTTTEPEESPGSDAEPGTETPGEPGGVDPSIDVRKAGQPGDDGTEETDGVDD